MIGSWGRGWLACAGLLVGCLSPRQTAVVGGSGVALGVVSVVALQPADCGAIVEGDDGGCGFVSFPVGIAAAALAIPLVAGAVINLIAGPVTPPPRMAEPPRSAARGQASTRRTGSPRSAR